MNVIRILVNAPNFIIFQRAVGIAGSALYQLHFKGSRVFGIYSRAVGSCHNVGSIPKYVLYEYVLIIPS